jgi:tetratricopeptide (TPR) repeat protein
VCAVGGLAIVACNFDPSRPFDRESPQVNQAIAALDAGDATAAAKTLEDYLSTGPCEDGNIGAKSDLLKRRPDGTFDLGLSLFKIGESFGRRFGEEENDAGSEEALAKRHAEIECALRLVRAVAEDESLPTELRARARYLEGNLSFLDAKYEDAVRAYDQALTLSPGFPNDAGDPVGRDAAYNRAIALRRIEDKKKDAGDDASSDASQDAPNDAQQDAPNEAGQDSGSDSGDGGGGGNDGGNDGGDDGGGEQDSGAPPPNDNDAGTPPPQSSANQDDRILDMFESSPTLQQEDAKRNASKRKVRGMEDK